MIPAEQGLSRGTLRWPATGATWLPSRMARSFEFFGHPGAFLEAASDHLPEQPAVSTVVSTIAERAVREIAVGSEQQAYDWYVLVRDGSAVVGAGMRTAPFPPRLLSLLPMPESAAEALAQMLWERGEEVRGTLPAVRRFADVTARLTGGTVEVAQHTRLFELHELTPAGSVPAAFVRPRTTTSSWRRSGSARSWPTPTNKPDEHDRPAPAPRGATRRGRPCRSLPGP